MSLQTDATTRRTTALECNVPGTESRTMSMLSLPVEKIDELAVPYPHPLDARPLTLTLREPLAVAIAKRTIDLILSVLGLVLTLALFPVLVLAIYLDSPGPI